MMICHSGPQHWHLISANLNPQDFYIYIWEEKKDLMYHKNMGGGGGGTLLLHILDAVTHVKDNPNKKNASYSLDSQTFQDVY
jgi:hypothetical protein